MLRSCLHLAVLHIHCISMLILRFGARLSLATTFARECSYRLHIRATFVFAPGGASHPLHFDAHLECAPRLCRTPLPPSILSQVIQL